MPGPLAGIRRAGTGVDGRVEPGHDGGRTGRAPPRVARAGGGRGAARPAARRTTPARARTSVPLIDDRAADAFAAALGDDYALTAREVQVARHLVRGAPNTHLARDLGISESTARHHTERVLAKLGVRSRAEVAWLAVGRRPTASAGAEAVPPAPGATGRR